MVEPVSLQTSLAQTIAAEKVTHVQTHHGEANQQMFAAELAKQDDQRAHKIQKTEESEQDQHVDDREERKREAREDEESARDEQTEDKTDDEIFDAEDADHLIDIVV
ncbi:MAG TPA: hypothetical protein VM163_05685 [bacterium]|nr:hypothetical protein [bacterium]